MPNYRRTSVPGASYFFTLVTYNRRPLFTEALARRCLRAVMEEVRGARPFVIDGICLLPEHLHCIWTLPAGDSDYSQRWNAIKGLFSKRFIALGGNGGTVDASRRKRGEVALWQRRFWEHLIRDEKDLERHLDYLHYNPVKHGWVNHVADWPWSSFHRLVKEGVYAKDWGGGHALHGNMTDTVGE